MMKACFIGHKTIEKSEVLLSSLKETVLTLINKGVTTFLFGSNSEFNDLSWKIVTELKKEYPFVKRIYVRSTHQHLEKSYEEYLLKFYETTYCPSKIINAGKSSYVKRNYEMIDNSMYCVFYYNENYIPKLKYPAKYNMLLPKNRNSGTKIAYDYAQKKNKEIINLFK